MNFWIEKYRPQTLDDVCLDAETKEYFQQFYDEIPHLLFVSEAGRGKTTMARILVNDILKCDYLYINASDETGIDNIRSKVTGFVQTKSFTGGIKVVVLDEADGLSKDAQKCLRNLMEDYSKFARFILTANYKHKIIVPLQSRCATIEFKTPLKDVVKRCIHILESEGVKFAVDKDFVKFIRLSYPDIRACIGELQKATIGGVLRIKEALNNNDLLVKIYESCESGKVLDLRAYLIENDQLFDNDYDQLLRNFLNYLYERPVKESVKKEAIVTIADSLFKSSMVIDKEINAFACFLTIENLLSEL